MSTQRTTFWKEYTVNIILHDLYNSNSSDVGKFLKYYRTLNNFTQSELASIIGYSNSSTIKDIELGKKLIGRNHSEKLAKFFNLDTRYFFDNYLEDTYSIAEKLKKYRKENNLNIKEAANKLNVAANTFGQWENRKAYPSRLLYPRLKELQIL